MHLLCAFALMKLGSILQRCYSIEGTILVNLLTLQKQLLPSSDNRLFPPFFFCMNLSEEERARSDFYLLYIYKFIVFQKITFGSAI